MPKTIADLPIGAKIKLGKYSVKEEEPHEVRWIKVHKDCTFLTEYLEDLLAFDAKEPTNEVGSRETHGNNRYSVSNIAQFINSFGSQWFKAMHEHDREPIRATTMSGFGYANKDGFLTNFEDWEIELLEESEVKTVIPTVDRVEGQQDILDVISAIMFLPSVTNLAGRKVSGCDEGEWWDYFRERNKDSRTCSPTVDCNAYHSYQGDTNGVRSSWYYNTRSAHAASSFNVMYCSTDGECSGCYDAAQMIMGCRPATKINKDVHVSDKPDADGYYEIIPRENSVVEITEEEFFTVIKI